MPRLSIPILLAVTALGGSVEPAARGGVREQATGQRNRPIELLRYLPFAVGDIWLYRDRVVGAEWLVTISEDSRRGSDQLLRWDDSSGDYRLISLSPEVGLLLHELHFFDGRELHFEEPLPILPPQLSLGETHRRRGRFVDLAAERESGGELKIEVTLTALAPIQTPAGGYEDCPLLRWRARLEGPFGAHLLEVETALAEGVGVIRLLGQISSKGPAGASPQQEAIHRVLQEANLGDSGGSSEVRSPPL